MIWTLMRQKETKGIKVVVKINVEGKKVRGRLENRWLDTIDNDIRAIGGRGIGNLDNQEVFGNIIYYY